MFNIQILGAYGAKSDKGGSSAFYLNDENVIDAGNLLTPLKEKNAQIKTIWLTHSHLDHIVDIAYILDDFYEQRTHTLTLCGLPETLTAIQENFLNHKIWPDFSQIPLKNKSAMSLVYKPIILGEKYKINPFTIEAFGTDHSVPSCGYIISQENDAMLISSDTYNLLSVIRAVEEHKNIRTLVIECSFPSSMEALATESKHLTPTLLFKQLAPLEKKGLKLYVNHMKPMYVERIMKEIVSIKGEWNVSFLTDGDKIYF